jgi:hypothetical protein
VCSIIPLLKLLIARVNFLPSSSYCRLAAYCASFFCHPAVSIQSARLRQIAPGQLLSHFVSSAFAHIHTHIGIALEIHERSRPPACFYSRRQSTHAIRCRLRQYHYFASTSPRRLHIVNQLSRLVSSVCQITDTFDQNSHLASDAAGSISVLSSAIVMPVLKCFFCTSSSVTLRSSLAELGSSRCVSRSSAALQPHAVSTR